MGSEKKEKAKNKEEKRRRKTQNSKMRRSERILNVELGGKEEDVEVERKD